LLACEAKDFCHLFKLSPHCQLVSQQDFKICPKNMSAHIFNAAIVGGMAFIMSSAGLTRLIVEGKQGIQPYPSLRAEESKASPS